MKMIWDFLNFWDFSHLTSKFSCTSKFLGGPSCDGQRAKTDWPETAGEEPGPSHGEGNANSFDGLKLPAMVRNEPSGSRFP